MKMNNLSKKNIGSGHDYCCEVSSCTTHTYKVEDAEMLLESYNVNVKDNREVFKSILEDIVDVLNNTDYKIAFHDGHHLEQGHSFFELSYGELNGAQSFIRSYIIKGTESYVGKKEYIKINGVEPTDYCTDVPNVEICIMSKAKEIIKYSIFTDRLRYLKYSSDNQNVIENGYVDSEGNKITAENDFGRTRKNINSNR